MTFVLRDLETVQAKVHASALYGAGNDVDGTAFLMSKNGEDSEVLALGELLRMSSQWPGLQMIKKSRLESRQPQRFPRIPPFVINAIADIIGDGGDRGAILEALQAARR